MEHTENLTSAEPVNPALFAFDAKEIEIPLVLRPNSKNPQLVFHRLRWPSKEEANELVNNEKIEYEDENRREERVVPGSDAHIIKLWEKIAIAVKGYDGMPTPVDQWHLLRPEDKANILPGNKTTAIRAIYSFDCELEDQLISINPDQKWTVIQTIGPRYSDNRATVRYVFRQPTEAERRSYRTEATTIINVKGLKKGRQRIKYNLKIYAQVFDGMVIDVDGGTVAGKTFRESDRTAFLDKIDPIYKRDVLQTLMLDLEAELQD
jgi:hypothetical protein